MTNPEATQKAETFMRLYARRWGKPVSLDVIPPGMTQEKFAAVMEYIVETGDSVLVGWNKLFLHQPPCPKKTSVL